MLPSPQLQQKIQHLLLSICSCEIPVYIIPFLNGEFRILYFQNHIRIFLKNHLLSKIRNISSITVIKYIIQQCILHGFAPFLVYIYKIIRK